MTFVIRSQGFVPDTGGEFANLYCGAHLVVLKDVNDSGFVAGGRYCLYRWHADNPVTFRKYLKYTIEHGHANDRGDNFYAVAYWYQSEPYTDFPPLPPVEERIPELKLVAPARSAKRHNTAPPLMVSAQCHARNTC